MSYSGSFLILSFILDEVVAGGKNLVWGLGRGGNLRESVVVGIGSDQINFFWW
jgi:hypothetical protein